MTVRRARANRRGPLLLAPAGAARRLGVDRDDVVASGMKRVQRLHREIRGAHEDQTHQVRFLSFA